jgi:hypothetical protein
MDFVKPKLRSRHRLTVDQVLPLTRQMLSRAGRARDRRHFAASTSVTSHSVV